MARTVVNLSLMMLNDEIYCNPAFTLYHIDKINDDYEVLSVQCKKRFGMEPVMEHRDYDNNGVISIK